ncbi:Isoflavone reductase IRL [Madurella mycetomatis]|uniref:Isoflavone reductase IRL n=1 Tax=Madurella mycetomatis TaxID=100816 RepID=A0A175WAW9_9PEZI|nr:Isoflavone reductase IRL [Madurella mycetomatis]
MQDVDTQNSSPHGVVWRRVDYEDVNTLVSVLRGVDVVLSFIQLLQDPGNKAQKNLIDAAVLAGVKRFAPSEWARVNENGKVLEYCLFQPGLFLNYLATPHKTAEYLTPLNTFVDIQNRRAIVVEGQNPIVTFTTVQDMAAVVARAVDFEGEWPVVGGIRGNHLAVSEIIKIGEATRGGPFSVDAVKLEDLEAGKLTVSSTIKARHSSVMQMPEEQAEAMAKSVLVGMLLSSAKGAWEVSNEWNRLLPDFEFTKMQDFLCEAWQAKP